jgi:hypothetical protein
MASWFYGAPDEASDHDATFVPPLPADSGSVPLPSDGSEEAADTLESLASSFNAKLVSLFANDESLDAAAVSSSTIPILARFVPDLPDLPSFLSSEEIYQAMPMARDILPLILKALVAAPGWIFRLVFVTMTSFVWRALITSVRFLLHLPFVRVPYIGLPLFLALPLLLLSLTALALKLLSIALPGLVQKAVPTVKAKSIDITLRGVTVKNLQLFDTNHVLLIASLVFPSAAQFQHPSVTPVAPTCAAPGKTSSPPILPIDPNKISSASIASLALSWSVTLASVTLPLNTISPYLGSFLSRFLDYSPTLKFPCVKLSLTISDLTVVARKAYSPYTNESAALPVSEGDHYHFPYAPSHAFLAAMNSARAAKITGLLSSYLPTQKQLVKEKDAPNDAMSPVMLSVLKTVLGLIKIRLSNTSVVLLHAPVADVLRAHTQPLNSQLCPTSPQNCEGHATAIVIQDLIISEYHKTSDVSASIIGLSIITGALINTDQQRQTSPKSASSTFNTSPTKASAFKAKSPKASSPAAKANMIPPPASATLTPVSVTSHSLPPSVTHTVSLPSGHSYAMAPFLSPVDVVVLLPTLPGIILNAVKFLQSPSPNAINIRIYSSLHISLERIHPVMHAFDDYVDPVAPYTLFCAKLYESMFSGIAFDGVIIPDEMKNGHRIGRVTKPEMTAYRAAYTASIHPAKPVDKVAVAKAVEDYTRLESRMTYDEIMQQRVTCHTKTPGLPAHLLWEVHREDRHLQQWLAWYGCSVRHSKCGYNRERVEADGSFDHDDGEEDFDSSSSSDSDDETGNPRSGGSRSGQRRNLEPAPVYPPLPPAPNTAVAFQNDVMAVAGFMEEKYGFVSPGFVLNLFVRQIKLDLPDLSVDRSALEVSAGDNASNEKQVKKKSQQEKKKHHYHHKHGGKRSAAPPKNSVTVPLDTCIFALDVILSLDMKCAATNPPPVLQKAPTTQKRVAMMVSIGVNYLSWKPDESIQTLSSSVPMLNDNSACAILHRLDSARATEERPELCHENDPQFVGEQATFPFVYSEFNAIFPSISADAGSGEGREPFKYNMVSFTLESSEFSNSSYLDEQPIAKAMEVLLEDVIIVALPSLLKAGLDGLTKVLEFPYITEDTEKIVEEKRKIEEAHIALSNLTESARSARRMASLDMVSEDDDEDASVSISPPDLHVVDDFSAFIASGFDGGSPSSTPSFPLSSPLAADASPTPPPRSPTPTEEEPPAAQLPAGENAPLIPPRDSGEKKKRRNTKDLTKMFGAEFAFSPDNPANPRKKDLTEVFGSPIHVDAIGLTPKGKYFDSEFPDHLSVRSGLPDAVDHGVVPVPLSPLTPEALAADYDFNSPNSPAVPPSPPRDKAEGSSSSPSHASPSKPASGLPPVKTNGTIFGGQNVFYKITARNFSVALLLDEKALDSGLIDINISKLMLLVDSFEETEEIKLRTGAITARGCRLGGSTANFPRLSAISVIYLPFKHAAEVGPISIVYSGYSRAENTRVILPVVSNAADSVDANFYSADDVVGTVYVDIKSNIESVYINVTPSLNAVFTGCLAQLLDKFKEDDAAAKAHADKLQQELEEAKTKTRILRTAHQKAVLLEIWNDIDTDNNKKLDQSEVKEVVQRLLKKTSLKGGHKSLELTPKELERELNNFMLIVDVNGDQEISYEELENAMFSMTKKKDNDRNSDNSDSNMMRGIVYFSNLKEFASSSVVHQITGSAVTTAESFGNPYQWENKNGVKDFVEIYEQACGCTRDSLNGQDVDVVQSKLVRRLENYAFAKHCWFAILRPTTHKEWVLDHKLSSSYTSGAIETLALQVQQKSTESQARLRAHHQYRYDTSVVFGVDLVQVCAGNALVFSKSLVNLGVKNCHASSKFVYVNDEDKGLVFSSGEGPAEESPSRESMPSPRMTRQSSQSSFRSLNSFDSFDAATPISSPAANSQPDATSVEGFGLQVHCELTIYMKYLDTTHDVMENLVSDWSVYADYSYAPKSESPENMNAFQSDENVQTGQSRANTVRTSLNVMCPDFLQIDFTPSAIKTLSILQESLAVTPEVFERLSEKRVLEELKAFWDATAVEGESELTADQVTPIVRAFLGTTMGGSGQMEGEKLDELTRDFIQRVDLDNDNAISYHELEVAVKSRSLSAKSVFENSNLIRIENRIGEEFNYATSGEQKELRQSSSRRGATGQCPDGKIKALKMGEKFMSAIRSRKGSDEETIAIKLKNYDVISHIKVSAFQSVFVPLNHNGVKKLEPASHFFPSMIVSPVTDSLETVTLQVRSSFTIKAHTQVVVEIVRVGNTALVDHSVKHNKSFFTNNATLQTLLNDSKTTVVFKKSLKVGETASIPLHVTTHSHMHMISVRDTDQKSREQWRDPIVLNRSWLWNPSNSHEITELHSSRCINVEKIRLSAHRPPPPKNFSAAVQPQKCWETVVYILPSLILSIAMPFKLEFRCYQERTTAAVHDEKVPGKRKFSNLIRRGSNAKAVLLNSNMPVHSEGRAKSSAAASRAANLPFDLKGSVPSGGDIKLNGVDMRQPLIIEIFRDEIDSGVVPAEGSRKVCIDLEHLKAGRTIEGIRGRLEDDVDFRVSGVTLRNQTRRLTIFSPYWIMNKTGMLMSYTVSGRKFANGSPAPVFDSSVEGFPVLVDSGGAGSINMEGNSVTVAPNEAPNMKVVNDWWNKKNNGEVKCPPIQLVKNGVQLVEASEKIGLDNVGLESEIQCGSFVYGVTVETMTGVFHGSNLMTIWPRFFVRNEFAMPIEVVAICGKKEALMKSTDRDWDAKKYVDKVVRLQPRESCVIFNFDKAFSGGNTSEHTRFICFRVLQQFEGEQEPTTMNQSSYNASGKKRVHLVPANVLGSFYYSERMHGCNGLARVLVCKNTKSEATTIVTISDSSSHPPFRLENRSTDHSILFIQDDDFAEPIVLPPMTWCAYAWDNPQGQLRMRAIVEAKLKDSRHTGLEVAQMEASERAERKRKKARDRLGRALHTARTVMRASPKRKDKLLKSNRQLLEDMTKENGGMYIGDDGFMRDSATGKLVENFSPGSDNMILSADDDSSTKSTETRLSFHDMQGFDAVHLRNAYINQLFTRNARTYCIDKVGERKSLPCPFPSELVGSARYKDKLGVLVKIIKGTKFVSFNESDFIAKESKENRLKSGGDWKGVQTSIRIQGVSITLIDDVPQELLNIVLREFHVEKKMDSVEIVVRLRHLQIDNMLEGAKYPIVLGPAVQVNDERHEKDSLGSELDVDVHGLDRAISKANRANATAKGGSEKHYDDVYWETYNQKPLPALEIVCDYLPLTHMVWVPKLEVFLLPLKLKVDLSYILKVVDVIMSSIPEASETMNEADVQEAYSVVNRKYEAFSHHAADENDSEETTQEAASGDKSDLTYVESLCITHTRIEVELYLRPEDDTGAEEVDTGVDSSTMTSTLDSIGRGTSSSVGAAMLTWLTNVGASFAHISPTFEFKELKLDNRFGPFNELSAVIVDHYIKTLMLQSYKLLSIHLLGDPFSLVNNVTSGAVNFITITKDELMAGGKDGFGGGVASLVQGVVGGTFKSSSMILGGMTDLISEVSGNGQVMHDVKSGKGQKEHAHHLGEGVVQGGEFFVRSLAKGIVGILEKPAKGGRKGAIGFASGLVTGVGGLVASPFVATLGASAIIAESVDETTRMFDQRAVECRVRPRRIVHDWGYSLGEVGLPTLKAIGVRVHWFRFTTKDDAEAKRAHHKKKIVVTGPDGHMIKMKTKSTTNVTMAHSDLGPGEQVFQVVFDDDVGVLRSRNLQLSSEIKFEVWDKSVSTAVLLAVTIVKVEDLWGDLAEFHSSRMNAVCDKLSKKGGSDWRKELEVIGAGGVGGARSPSPSLDRAGSQTRKPFLFKDVSQRIIKGLDQGSSALASSGRMMSATSGRMTSATSMTNMASSNDRDSLPQAVNTIAPKRQEYVMSGEDSKNVLFAKFDNMMGDVGNGVAGLGQHLGQGVVVAGKGSIKVGGKIAGGVTNAVGGVTHAMEGIVKRRSRASSSDVSLDGAVVDGGDVVEGGCASDGSDEGGGSDPAVAMELWEEMWEDDETTSDVSADAGLEAATPAKTEAKRPRRSSLKEGKDIGVINISFFPVEF